MYIVTVFPSVTVVYRATKPVKRNVKPPSVRAGKFRGLNAMSRETVIEDFTVGQPRWTRLWKPELNERQNPDSRVLDMLQ